tara:strand:- start:69 stop:479 length:411 start_codon:yes stop_codon:yes gene_type:complete
VVFTLLRTFDRSIDAHLLKLKLESEGIKCYIFHENTATLTPIAIGAISFKVNQEDFQKAYEIMTEMQRPIPKDEDGNIIACPHCEASKLIFIQKKQNKKLKGVLSQIKAFFIANKISVIFCEGCKKEYDLSSPLLK